jgi:hypothetical protein
MAEQQQSANRSEFEQRLIAKALSDEAFARELTEHPRAVLERELAEKRPGIRLPEQVQVEVLQETPSTVYLVLPPRPAARPTGELADEELERVAGGEVEYTYSLYNLPDDQYGCIC